MVMTKPALLALLESAVAAQPSGNGLQAERRRQMARTLCQNGVNGASWELANKLAQSWGMSCSMFGIDRPADEEGERRRGMARR